MLSAVGSERRVHAPEGDLLDWQEPWAGGRCQGHKGTGQAVCLRGQLLVEGEEEAMLPKSLSTSHTYQSDSGLRRQREATSVGLVELSLPEGNHREWKPSPHPSVLSWKSVPWTWTSGKVSVSKVSTFVGIMTWLLVITERWSPLHLGCFPPQRQPQRESVLSVPAPRPVFLAGGVVNSRGPRGKREGAACVCLSSGEDM